MHEHAPERLYPEHVAKSLRTCVDQVKAKWRPLDDQRFNSFLIALYRSGAAWPDPKDFRHCLVFGGFERWLSDYHIKRLTTLYGSGQALLAQFENVTAKVCSDAPEFDPSSQASFSPIVMQPTKQLSEQPRRPGQPR